MRRVVVLLFMVLSGCGEEREEGSTKGEGEKRPEPVTVVETRLVARGEVAETLSSTAVVESASAADLVPAATGIVRTVEVDEGDAVRAGEVLAVLENVSLDASATRANDEMALLEKQVQELQALQSRGAVSDKELEDLRFQLRTAQVSNREASATRGQTRITAPFDGVVASRSIRVGELASSVEPAFQIVDLERLRVVVSLPERDLPRVALGQPVHLASAYDEARWENGIVSRVAPVVDPTSGTFRVTVELVADTHALRPGQFVTAALEVARERDVLTVPRRAVVYEDGAPVLFVVTEADEELDEDEGSDSEEVIGWASWWPDGWGGEPEETVDEEGEEVGPHLVATRKPVRVGLLDSESAQIHEGVSVGDEVIVVGQSHLRDGARVRHAGLDEDGPAVASEDEP